jgi:hypothetical protein
MGRVRVPTLTLGLWLAFAGALGADDAPQAPALTHETYAALKAAIAPAPEECVWREIGWRPTFGDAVAEARRDGKPIFLWAMNGHPLACV